MKTDEIRHKYLNFFKERGHEIIPSASLVPENDPTTLFTGSGMQPLLPYLLGEKHQEGQCLVNSQKCFRGEDIEEVGDNRHTTFFEMLGNWSLGSYFKKEQLPWIFEFLTDKKEGVGLKAQNLYITVFAGDEKNNIPKDRDSIAIWKKLFSDIGIDAKDAVIGNETAGYELGIKLGERIFAYDATKNWWSRAGVPENMPAGEPGGPDSEIFYDFDPTGATHDKSLGKCHPNCECGRFMEIGNSVFMEYIKKPDGSFEPLPQKNVDFGGGLERIAAASSDNADVFLVNALSGIIQQLEIWTKKKYGDGDENLQKSFRIIADHMRGALFMIDDGVLPTNTERGYLLRRLIRRAVLHADKIGVEVEKLHHIVETVFAAYRNTYTSLHGREADTAEVILREEQTFRKTLERGLREFKKVSNKDISGHSSFVLFSTYGFPLELTQELAEERGVKVDAESFQKEMKKHQKQSRAGAEQKFKGGLADQSGMSVKYHTATHLLHQALRDVLGESVLQKGSNITPERLRFDFAFERKMSDEEKKEVESVVNAQVTAALPVTHEDIPKEEAEKRGAIGLFEEKYGEMVRVYKIGDYSLEYCGGPHVSNTNELGTFRIAKEEAVAAGIRRIKAVLE